MSNHTATVYLKLAADRYSGRQVTRVKAVGVTQNKPAFLEVDQVAVKVNLTVPAALFDAHPVVTIDIPEDAVVIRPVAATVEEATE